MNSSVRSHSGAYDVTPTAGSATSTLCQMFERLFSRGSQRHHHRHNSNRRTLSSTSSAGDDALGPHSSAEHGGSETHPQEEVIPGVAHQVEQNTGLCAHHCTCLNSNSYGPGKEAFRRGIILLIIAIILFATGAILTGLGQSMLGAGFVQLTGPLFIGIALLLVLVAAGYITIAKRLRQEYTNRRHRMQLHPDEFDEVDYDDPDSATRDPSIPPSANILPPTYSDAILEDHFSTVTPTTEQAGNSGDVTQLNNNQVVSTGRSVVFALDSEGSASQDENSNVSSYNGAEDESVVDVLPGINENEEMQTLPPTYTEVLLGTPEGENMNAEFSQHG
ncbi:uncharacterized protein LOC106153155 isoform X1 [Lingula anatina]|uniref:Uncharacterized protein LOC106153155 isoform X1 n=1 Tax=Lingula anatina TaxID=7574 RepID=A0A1S3H8U3_LINAN|nr:uncharacterized protein LOC106153155 isoform X1 [Lingula anatina]|eukprot:XP_013382433.1 uncharacterized protein LOC106153155 isoform X1 [Lingula anatina]